MEAWGDVKKKMKKKKMKKKEEERERERERNTNNRTVGSIWCSNAGTIHGLFASQTQKDIASLVGAAGRGHSS